MKEIILGNLSNISLGALLFTISYMSNVCFSLFYNIKILNYAFDKEKFLTGILKLITFILGTLLLCLGISILPTLLEQTDITVSEEVTSVLSNTAVVSLFIITSTRYLVEAFNTMKSIIDNKKDY